MYVFLKTVSVIIQPSNVNLVYIHGQDVGYLDINQSTIGPLHSPFSLAYLNSINMGAVNVAHFLQVWLLKSKYSTLVKLDFIKQLPRELVIKDQILLVRLGVSQVQYLDYVCFGSACQNVFFIFRRVCLLPNLLKEVAMQRMFLRR